MKKSLAGNVDYFKKSEFSIDIKIIKVQKTVIAFLYRIIGPHKFFQVSIILNTNTYQKSK